MGEGNLKISKFEDLKMAARKTDDMNQVPIFKSSNYQIFKSSNYQIFKS